MDFPGVEWTVADDVTEAGFDPAKLAKVAAHADLLPTTGLLVVAGDRVVLDHGDTAGISYVASVRKSLLSILYGKAVAEGRIDLDATLEWLDIDDVGGLLPVERQARVRDLLTARSGVYHPAATPGGDEDMPERGSQRPGANFVYNNWDFNVLGTVFERCTGRDLFTAFGEDLAVPLGFQDFDRDRQRLLGVPERSRHLAHHFFLSARDLARIGLLMVRCGQWADRQIVPGSWVGASTSVQVPPGAAARLDYGYLWWLPRIPGPDWAGVFLAAGNYGQYVLGLPALDLVIVHRRAVPNEFAIARNQTMGANAARAPERVTVPEFLQLTRQILAARTGA